MHSYRHIGSLPSGKSFGDFLGIFSFNHDIAHAPVLWKRGECVKGDSACL